MALNIKLALAAALHLVQKTLPHSINHPSKRCAMPCVTRRVLAISALR